MNDASYGCLFFKCNESVVNGRLAATLRLRIVVATGENR